MSEWVTVTDVIALVTIEGAYAPDTAREIVKSAIKGGTVRLLRNRQVLRWNDTEDCAEAERREGYMRALRATYPARRDRDAALRHPCHRGPTEDDLVLNGSIHLGDLAKVIAREHGIMLALTDAATREAAAGETTWAPERAAMGEAAAAPDAVLEYQKTFEYLSRHGQQPGYFQATKVEWQRRVAEAGLQVPRATFRAAWAAAVAAGKVTPLTGAPEKRHQVKTRA